MNTGFNSFFRDKLMGNLQLIGRDPTSGMLLFYRLQKCHDGWCSIGGIQMDEPTVQKRQDRGDMVQIEDPRHD